MQVENGGELQVFCLDNALSAVSYLGMQNLFVSPSAEIALQPCVKPVDFVERSRFALFVVLGPCLLASGCRVSMAPLAKHTAEFSSATSLVVDNSTSAYRTANDLHDQEQVSAGAIKIQEGEIWDFHGMTPLISKEGMDARLQILDALKSYAQSLSDVTSGLDSSALKSTATSKGSNLQATGESIQSDQGAKSGFSIDAQTANLVNTAAHGLGEYLQGRKAAAALPSITREMDPHVDTLCKLLTDDIDILRRQSKNDYDDLLRQQWSFISENRKTLTPIELRDEVGKLAVIQKAEQSNDAMLEDLHSAVARLALTHHALAAAAQGNNPEGLRARIADLEAAGENLAHYYQGLAPQVAGCNTTR